MVLPVGKVAGVVGSAGTAAAAVAGLAALGGDLLDLFLGAVGEVAGVVALSASHFGRVFVTCEMVLEKIGCCCCAKMFSGVLV